MSGFIRVFVNVVLISFVIGTGSFYCQTADETKRQLVVLEKEYNDLLTSALQSQVRADSLVRVSNHKRTEISASTNEAVRARLSNEVLLLEKQAFEIQAETNRKYASARDMEMRLITLRRSLPDVQPTSPAAVSIKAVDAKKDERLLLSFLYGKPELEAFIGPGSLFRLKSIESNALQVNKTFNEVSEINQEIENIKILIDSNPRARKNRTHRKTIDELTKKAAAKNMEALAAVEGINSVKLEVLADVVNTAKVRVTNRDIIQMASVHESAANEHIREASESRKVAAELSTEKFSHDYMMRAYLKEMVAMEELHKAFDLFTGRSAAMPVVAAERPVTRIQQPAVEANPIPFLQEHKTYNTHAAEKAQVTEQTVIKTSEPEIPLNVSLPAGLTYRIQVGIYQNDVKLPDFSNLPNVTGETEEGNGSTRYYSGMYTRFGEAERALMDIRRFGFRDAFIVSYLDGRRIPVNRAVSMEREREERPAVAVTPLVTPEPEPARPVRETAPPVQQTADRIVFKVQIGVFRNIITTENRDRFMRLAGNEKLEYIQNNSGFYVYTIGNFNTFEEAVQTRDKLVAGGINDAFVVVFRNGEKVPLNQVIR